MFLSAEFARIGISDILDKQDSGPNFDHCTVASLAKVHTMPPSVTVANGLSAEKKC
jgi:hypothetical protein